MKINVLASGSRGNMTIVSYKETKIMIDAGISLRQVNQRLNLEANSFNMLDAVLITHEHSDHTQYLNSIYKKLKPSLYMSYDSFTFLRQNLKEGIDISNVININDLEEFSIGELKILPIALSHDSKGIFGFVITSPESSICYITDTGYLNKRYYDYIKDKNLYLLESNHEPDLVLMSNRPFLLKQRILSDKGHLSNQDSAYIVNDLASNNSKVVFMHLSRECNSELVASMAHQKYLNKKLDVYYASQDVALEEIEV